MNALQTHVQSHIGRMFSWLTTGLVAILCFALAAGSARLVEIFANMFQQLEVELPWPTRWFLATYVWLLPLSFIALATFVIWKEFSVRELRRKFVLTMRAFFATLGAVALVMFLLYLPLFTLAAKLAETK